MTSQWTWQRFLLIAAVFIHSSLAAILTQTYCSSQNTGSDFPVVAYAFSSLGSCQTECQDDYAFAVVQGTECWCSNYAPAEQLPVYQCSKACPGYPYEWCGNSDENLYGYEALSIVPSGTIGASESTVAPTTTAAPTATAAPATSSMAETTTVVAISDHTVVSTQVVVSTEAVVSTEVNSVVTSQVPVTIYQTKTATQQVTVVPLASSTSASPTLSPTSSPTSSPSSLGTTSIQRITVSGAVVTQVVTESASQASESASSTVLQQTRHGLSSGAAAGIAIGVILALVLLGLLFFFCCWRPRRRNGDAEGGLNRNTSVLSKAGLLRSTSDRTGTGASARPRLQTTGLSGKAGSDNPMSADSGTPGTMTTQRDVQPLFIDQRLNPLAWGMQHPNTSQTSVGTIHDNRDYSRPLEVRNPDQQH